MVPVAATPRDSLHRVEEGGDGDQGGDRTHDLIYLLPDFLHLLSLSPLSLSSLSISLSISVSVSLSVTTLLLSLPLPKSGVEFPSDLSYT